MDISICMATRNKAAILDATLASIRQQRIFAEYEIIVADDGSTDDTCQVCRKHGAVYLYLDNGCYRNPATARNEAYRHATGKVVIAQSDDVVHRGGGVVETLARSLTPDSVVIGTVLNMVAGTEEPCHTPFHVYSGTGRPRAFFFLGALWRDDIYRIGGNDGRFIEPCWDDNWFEDCLLKGLKREIVYATDALGHHQHHDFPNGSHDNADASHLLYNSLRHEAARTGAFWSLGAPWPETWPTIPKRMSFFWGGERLSWMRYLTLESFRKHHPDWEMKLYRVRHGFASQWQSHEQEDATGYAGRDYSEAVGALGVEVVPWVCPVEGASVTHASDICQWEILSAGGGFYSDMDILWIKPIPYEVAAQADVMTCLSMGYMTIGFLGASPNSPVFSDVSWRARAFHDPARYQSTGAEAIYSLAGLGTNWGETQDPGRVAVASFRRRFPHLRFREMRPETVYPWNYTQVASIFSECHEPPPECIGIHWFGANPLAQRWNNTLTPDNWRQYRNTFTHSLEAIL